MIGIDSGISHAEPLTLYVVTKRFLDIVISIIGIILMMPIMACIAILIRIDSPGAVLFQQQRPGKGNQLFKVLKFRTMYDGSHRLSVEVLREASFGPLRKKEADPRITPIGRILRRFSLDELPQLINVLKGEMSIVGPRPLLGWEFADHPEEEAVRLSVKPGLTGLWQIRGRSNLPFEDLLRLDVQYVKERSLWLDLKIMLKTFPCVLKGDGAY